MAKKKALSAAAWHKTLSDDALERMRTYKDPKRDKDDLDGLAAAICFLAATGVAPPDWPDWVRNRLVMQALEVAVVRGGTHRQNKLRGKAETFENDLMRYTFVMMCDAEKNPDRYVVGWKTRFKILNGQKLDRRESAQFTKSPAKSHGRRSNTFEDAFAQMEGSRFAPEDSSGMRQSYYRIQRMFGSKSLMNYVAVRVVEGLMSQL